jgi:hypothetical protein
VSGQKVSDLLSSGQGGRVMKLIRKRVGKEWTWFESYIYVSASYVCFTPPDRRVQVGMGVFAFGRPLGEKIAICERGSFTVIGVGAIHIRVYDDGPDCEVAISQDSNVLVPILRTDF